MLETWAVVPRWNGSRSDGLMTRGGSGGEAERERRGPGDVLAGVEEAQVHAGLAGELLDDLAVLFELVEVTAETVTSPA